MTEIHKPRNLAEDPRRLAAAYVIEANDAERHFLWLLNSKVALERGWGTGGFAGGIDWPDVSSSSWGTMIGEMDGRRIVVITTFDTICGVPVVFWHPSSQLVDHAMIEKWLPTMFPAYERRLRCDAANFAHFIAHLRENGKVTEHNHEARVSLRRVQ